jgi:hypothetical protein
MSCFRGALAVGLLAAAVAIFACSKPPPPSPPPPPPAQPAPPPPPPAPAFKVARMDLGRAVGIDKQVTAPADNFGPKDTIYLSVVTDGLAPAVVLRAKWTYGPKGLLVKDSSESIASLGPKATDFILTKSTPWPLGKYTVELFVDDKSAGSKQFDVVAKMPVKKK